MGEVGMAFVVLRPGATVTEAELVAFCREEMANYKVPRHVRFLDALPLDASNKVLKFQLRDEGVASLETSRPQARRLGTSAPTSPRDHRPRSRCHTPFVLLSYGIGGG